jgi:hypothetical protein
MRRKKESPIAEEVISVVAITGAVLTEAVVRAEVVITVAAVAAMAEVATTVVAETADPDIKKPRSFLDSKQGALYRASL